MKKILLILLLSIIYQSGNAQAQKQLYVGLNGSRLLYNFVQGGGFSIDPVVKYKYKFLLFEGEGGYTSARRGPNGVRNLEYYKNEGYYARAGIGFHIASDFYAGVGFTHSQSLENFQMKLNGNVFNNFSYNYVRGVLNTEAIDMRFQSVYHFSKKLALACGLNIVYMTSFIKDRPIPVEFSSLPYVYIVGVGSVLFTSYQEQRPTKLTLNVHFQLLYNIGL